MGADRRHRAPRLFALSCSDIATVPRLFVLHVLISRPSPAFSFFMFCHRNLPPLSSRPTPAVISTAGRDLKQAWESFTAEKNRFLASLRNDSGGGVLACALSGTTGFLASLRNDSGGGILACTLPGTTGFPATLDIGKNRKDRGRMTPRPAPAVTTTCSGCHRDLLRMSPRPAPCPFTLSCCDIATTPRCHRDLPPLSSRPTPAVISTAGRDLKQAWESFTAEKNRFLASLRNDSGGWDLGLRPTGNNRISRYASK